MKPRFGFRFAAVGAVLICAYAVSLAAKPPTMPGKQALNKTEQYVRQLMSDVYREKRTLSGIEAEKLFKFASQPRHEAHEAAVVLLTFGTREQKATAREQAFQIASTQTELQRLCAVMSLSYAKDDRWKAIAESIPESDSGYQFAQALLAKSD